MHGNPAAFNDKLVEDLITLLQKEHESWISVFNIRATKVPAT